MSLREKLQNRLILRPDQSVENYSFLTLLEFVIVLSGIALLARMMLPQAPAIIPDEEQAAKAPSDTATAKTGEVAEKETPSTPDSAN